MSITAMVSYMVCKPVECSWTNRFTAFFPPQIDSSPIIASTSYHQTGSASTINSPLQEASTLHALSTSFQPSNSSNDTFASGGSSSSENLTSEPLNETDARPHQQHPFIEAFEEAEEVLQVSWQRFCPCNSGLCFTLEAFCHWRIPLIRPTAPTTAASSEENTLLLASMAAHWNSFLPWTHHQSSRPLPLH